MTPTLPLVHTVGVRRHQGTTKDAHGNVIPVYADPVDWAVHAIAPGAMVEPDQAMRDASHVLWTVYGPADGGAPNEWDRVVYRGDEYAVDGHPKRYDDGPWAFEDAGVVVELKKVEG